MRITTVKSQKNNDKYDVRFESTLDHISIHHMYLATVEFLTGEKVGYWKGNVTARDREIISSIKIASATKVEPPKTDRKIIF